MYSVTGFRPAAMSESSQLMHYFLLHLLFSYLIFSVCSCRERESLLLSGCFSLCLYWHRRSAADVAECMIKKNVPAAVMSTKNIISVSAGWLKAKVKRFQHFPLGVLSRPVMKTTCCVEDNSRLWPQLTRWWKVIIIRISLHNCVLELTMQPQRASSTYSLSGSRRAERCTRQTDDGLGALLANRLVDEAGCCCCDACCPEQNRRQMISSALVSCSWRQQWCLLYITSNRYRLPRLQYSYTFTHPTYQHWYGHHLLVTVLLTNFNVFCLRI